MMSIGEFAHLTGLTIKALRLYDERGLLTPADVDPQSRYRRYAAEQLRPAARIRALREAGLGLDDIAAAVRDPDRASELLSSYSDRVLTTREAEDRAWHRAAATLTALEQRMPVEVMNQSDQPYAAAVVTIAGGDDDDSAADREADAAFGAVWQALVAAGALPTGPFWTSMRHPAALSESAEDDGGIELLLCWPVDAVPKGFEVPGTRIETGVLPASLELRCRVEHATDGDRIEHATDGDRVEHATDGDRIEHATDGDEEATGEAIIHPATIALLEQAEVRGVEFDLSRLRQIGAYDENGAVIGMDWAYPI